MEHVPGQSKKEVEATMLKKLEELHRSHIEDAEKELAILKDSLHDLAERIEHEKPYALVFLDKSARPFGTPFKKYLEETMGDTAPHIGFYNDAYLKQAYLDKDTALLKEIVEEELSHLKGRKVFFIDETYSRGRGAAALSAAREELGKDIWYFALSKDPSSPPLKREEADFPITEEDHSKNIESVSNDPHFILYPNEIELLFSRLTSQLYTDETDDGYTKGARNFTEKDAGEVEIETSDFESRARKMTFDTIRTIKQKIYETLKAQDTLINQSE